MADIELKWTKCNCGSPHCKREYPNMGMFYQGCGFEPEEKELINRAFAALNRETKFIEAKRKIVQLKDEGKVDQVLTFLRKFQ